MDESLSPFLIRVLKCVPERFTEAKRVSQIYEGLYPPPFIFRALGKMRSRAFEEKEVPRGPIKLEWELGHLSRSGYIKHKLSDYVEDETDGLSLYMLSDKGRSYLLSLKKKSR